MEVGIGTRVLNFLIDTLLIFFIAFGLYKWWSFHVMFWDYTFIPFYIFFYFSIFVYYSIFELIWSRTPGKWLTMSKVKNTAGSKPAWYQIIARSALRLTLISPFFIPFLGRPLHDALSKTRVVEVTPNP